MKNILIVSPEKRKSLVEVSRKSIRQLGYDSKVYICYLEPSVSSACSVSDGSFAIFLLISEDYMPVLQSICIGNQVKLVIPTVEKELPKIRYCEYEALPLYGPYVRSNL